MYDKKHNKTYWVDGIFFGQMYIVFAFDSSLGWQEKTKQLFALRMPENKNIKKTMKFPCNDCKDKIECLEWVAKHIVRLPIHPVGTAGAPGKKTIQWRLF